MSTFLDYYKYNPIRLNECFCHFLICYISIIHHNIRQLFQFIYQFLYLRINTTHDIKPNLRAFFCNFQQIIYSFIRIHSSKE